MKTVSILVPEGAVLAGIADPRYMFTAVNDFLQKDGNPPLFKVQLVGLAKEVKLNDGQFSVHTDLLLEEAEYSDLVIVPPLSGNLKNGLRINAAFLPWIVEQYETGAEVASLCIGAFLLASTGLLNGKNCSTHWLYVNEFRAMFPEVNVVDDKIVTEQNGLYSSGGATSYWNLLLHIVEKYTDRHTAILASKFFAIDIGRNSQSDFVLFQGQKEHEDNEVKKVQEFIEKNFMDKMTVDQLSDMFGMGRRSFERRFKKSTCNTVVEYIQRVKIEAAKRQLEMGRKTVNEVMYDVGYIDNKAFRDVFKKITGMSPIDYRNKYNKEAFIYR